MRKWLLLILFAGVFLFALAANAPLSFALKKSGVIQQGVSWQQARGTVWHGQVTGLAVRGEPIGAVEGDFSLMRALGGKPGHLLHWVGPQGRGSGLVAPANKGLRIEEGRTALTFNATRISPMFPSQDVDLRLSNASIEFDQDGCLSASANVVTDALARISTAYGSNWPELSGTLSCQDGDLIVSVEGQAADGTHIAASASLSGRGRLELWDVPENQVKALLVAGFTDEAGRLVYEQPIPNGGSIQ